MRALIARKQWGRVMIYCPACPEVFHDVWLVSPGVNWRFLEAEVGECRACGTTVTISNDGECSSSSGQCGPECPLCRPF